MLGDLGDLATMNKDEIAVAKAIKTYACRYAKWLAGQPQKVRAKAAAALDPAANPQTFLTEILGKVPWTGGTGKRWVFANTVDFNTWLAANVQAITPAYVSGARSLLSDAIIQQAQGGCKGGGGGGGGGGKQTDATPAAPVEVEAGMSTGAKVAIGVGGALVLGGLVWALSRRSSPAPRGPVRAPSRARKPRRAPARRRRR